MKRLKKGDEVIVTAGKDKGRQGVVLSFSGDDRVVVEGINLVKKHQKGNPQTGQQGGIIEKEMPIHVSNVMPYNPVTEKGDRIGIKTLEDGRRVRYFKSNQEVLDTD
jgi:large subunit ribosomal protein L24